MLGFHDSNGKFTKFPLSSTTLPPTIRLFNVVEETVAKHFFPYVCRTATGDRYYNGKISRKKMLEIASKDFGVEFLFQWATNRSDLLEGLDIEPKFEAHALAEFVLEQCGVKDESPKRKHAITRSLLRIAVSSKNSVNERNIHDVIGGAPGVLQDEIDIEEFHSKRPLQYGEVQKIDNELVHIPREVIPDFIYKMHGGDFIIVEIEAASKQVILSSTETGFNIFSAKANKALAQIRNYKTVVEKHGNSTICEQLGCPSTTNFRFLLVIGSTEQNSFDERSWEHAVQQLSQEGIELRHWDYFLDRLERRQKAAEQTVNLMP